MQAEEMLREGQGTLKISESQQVLFLKGTPYEMGYQHGKLLKDNIARNVRRYIDQKILYGANLSPIKEFLDALPMITSYIPLALVEEMQGVAEGSQIPYEKILLLNLFPEMFHCTGLTVSGQATEDRKLFHVRVLDYGAGQNLQDSAVLIVQEPKGKIPFLNVSYAGFVGSITGMNAKHIAVGEIGGKGYGHWQGIPMAFLLRQILEEAGTLEEVKSILNTSSRTCEYYYVFSDGKNGESIAVYATPEQVTYIEPGSTYALLNSSPYNKDNRIVLTNVVVETTPYQTIIYEDENKEKLHGLIHRQLPDSLILIGFCHPGRYPIIIERLMQNFGKLNVSHLREVIKQPVARPTNLHNAIFAPESLEVWIAHAGPSGELACDQPYHHFQLLNLLEQK
jgi:hypothetical protein